MHFVREFEHVLYTLLTTSKGSGDVAALFCSVRSPVKL